MIAETHRSSQIIRYAEGASEARSTDLAIETEVGLSVNGETWLSFRCSPDNLESLAVGYLYNEGFIQSNSEVASVRVCEQGDHIDVWLTQNVHKPETWSRTSGCQGGSTQSGQNAILVLPENPKYPISVILAQIDHFLNELHKPDYPQRGVHSTMLFDGLQVKSISNDIGRHNTLDKIAGDHLQRRFDLSEPVVITTGRISSEMVSKTARMRIPLAISLHSISDMAAAAAEQAGMTLVGHARRSQIDIYSHAERILTGL